MESTVQLVRCVISTLNGIEVKGKENLDALLGSINALETVAQVLQIPPVPPEPTEEKKEDVNGR